MTTENDIPSWQRIGYQLAMLQQVEHNMEVTRLSWWLETPPTAPNDVWSWAMNWTGSGMAVFALGSMGFQFTAKPLSDWRLVGRKLVAVALHYFYGGWRNGYIYDDEILDDAQARATLEWMGPYREGLAVAASLNDWNAVDRLLQWPAADLPTDEGYDERAKEDNAFHIWLASRLRSEPAESAAASRATVERGRRRGAKMLLAASDALFIGKPVILKTELESYIRHYRKSQWRENRPDFGVCLDATILWHLARRHDLGELALAEDVAIYIARP